MPVLQLGSRRANFRIPIRRVYKEFNFDAPNEIGLLFLIMDNYPQRNSIAVLSLHSNLERYYKRSLIPNGLPQIPVKDQSQEASK